MDYQVTSIPVYFYTYSVIEHVLFQSMLVFINRAVRLSPMETENLKNSAVLSHASMQITKVMMTNMLQPHTFTSWLGIVQYMYV